MRTFIKPMLLIALMGAIFGNARADSEMLGNKGTDFGPVSTQSIFAVSSDPSQSGVNPEAVNLYTGQHAEAFPLASISGRGGFTASLTLSYNGNVTHMAKQENRLSQASPFGLGFDIGQQAIVCDHKGTADISDDDYQYVVGGSSVKLLHVEDNRYITESADPWLIYCETSLLDGISVVIGWTIKREDGTVFRYGDFSTDLSNPNATRASFRYGQRVGNGVLDDDELYPVGWDLHLVHDLDSLNWIEYKYLQERASLELYLEEDGDPVPSAHKYTRASHLNEICLSDGAKIVIDYETRTDCQPFYGLNIFEFYSTLRATEVSVYGQQGNLLSLIKLKYSYLTHEEDEFKKLLLEEIVNYSGKDPNRRLPSTKFEYYTSADDLKYGAIERILYPTGGHKEMHYARLDDSENLSQLDRTFGVWQERPRQFVSRNLVLSVSDVDESFISFWDGHWHQNMLNMSFSLHDRPGVSPDNEAIVFDRSIDDLVVLTWESGFLKHDTLVDRVQFTNEDNYQEGDYVYVYPGDECFLAIVVGSCVVYDGDILCPPRSAFYYRWDGNDWHDYAVQLGLTGYFHAAEISGDWFAVAQWIPDVAGNLNEQWVLSYGKFDARAGLLSTDRACTELPDYRFRFNFNFVVGDDYVAYIDNFNLKVCEFDGLRWVTQSLILNDVYDAYGMTDRHMWSLTHLENSDGMVCTYTNDYDDHYSYITTIFPTSEGWHARPNRLVDGTRINSLVGSSHFVTGQFADGSLFIGEWFGYRLWLNSAWDYYWPPWYYSPEIYRDAFAWGPKDYSCDLGQGGIKAWKYRGVFSGDDRWHALCTTPEVEGLNYAASDDFVVCNLGSANNLYLYMPFYEGIAALYKEFVINENSDAYLPCSRFYAAGNSFCVKDNRSVDVSPECYVAAYNVVDTVFKGKPQIVAVDRVAMSNFDSDPDPKVIDYRFCQGRLDQSGTTPRFTKAEVSTPYYYESEGEPDGWRVTYFYNDLSEYPIVDGHLDEYVCTPPLDPLDPYQYPYGRENGGYYLDGKPFLQYRYSTGGDLSELIDYQTFWYSFMRPPDSELVGDVYRAVLSRDTTFIDGMKTITLYDYDNYSGQLKSKSSALWKGNNEIRRTVNRLIYAFEDPADEVTASAMLDDNAITQVLYEEQDVYTHSPVFKVDSTSRAGRRYTRQGGWKVAEEFTWRDFANTEDTLFTVHGPVFDTLGNVVSSLNVENVRSVHKFDSSLTRVVALASNCGVNDLAVQDFEHGEDWDGWRNFALGTYRQLDDSDPFTGEYSYKITDNPDNLEYTWGPNKLIPVDSLTDDKYYFSFWAKANTEVRFHCFCRDENGDLRGERNFSFTEFSDTDWQKVEGVADFSNIDLTACENIEIRTVVPDGGVAVPGGWAAMDNFRFHPLNSHVETMVYDCGTGQISVRTGLNNIPERYEYDIFSRLSTEKNFAGRIRARYSKRFSMTESSAEVRSYGACWEFSEDIAIQADQTVSFFAHIEDGFLVHGMRTSIYLNGELVWEKIFDESYAGQSIDFDHSDEFDVFAGDAVRLEAQSCEQVDFTSVAGILLYYLDYGANPENPGYNKTANYFAGSSSLDSSVTVSFFDGLGELLQTRHSGYVPGDQGNRNSAAVVSGIVERDGRGRVLKDYKPYYDLIEPNGVLDYSGEDDWPSEVREYYDGINEADCGDYPYGEIKYGVGIKGLQEKKSAPGEDWCMGSGHEAHFEHEILADELVSRATTRDADSVKTIHEVDYANDIERDIQLYTDSDGDPAVVTYINYKSATGQTDSVGISDNDEPDVILRRNWYNDRGLADSTWRMDYGTVRMVYDRAGRLRFMQNDKRWLEGCWVYYKYDVHGNKIEEGLCEIVGMLANNIQALADTAEFPSVDWSDDDVVRKYFHEYDHRADDVSEINFGKLRYVSNTDSSYYRAYYYQPFEYSDSTVVKLLVEGGDTKSIVHKYDPLSGRPLEMTVYPHESLDGARAIAYTYDNTGVLNSIEEASVDGTDLGYERKISEMTYNALGQPKRRLVGVYDNLDEGSPVKDTLQVVDYFYNSLGMLERVNDPDNLQAQSGGTGEVNPHFGYLLDYASGGDGYYNGRVARVKTANSSPYGLKSQEYFYTYNELGWLTWAEHSSQDAYNREYWYNYLGNRDSVLFGYTRTTYDYDATPGSSRLIGFNHNQPTRSYDLLGNMVTDYQNYIYELGYDYRNLMTTGLVRESYDGGDPQELFFTYDDLGQRIFKQFHYCYKVECETPGPPNPHIKTAPTGDSGDFDRVTLTGGKDKIKYCPEWDKIEEHYLYDGGSLLMIFDREDSVQQYYVNGPSGREAVYRRNRSDRRYYIFSDQVGSTRLLLDDGGEVIQWNLYYPFGDRFASWVTYDDPMKFSGKERDEHSSFDYYYFGARYYDPVTGQFLSADKAAQFASGFNYASNNPLLLSDPDGNFFFVAGIVFGAIQGGMYAQATGKNGLLCVLGGAAIGGFSGYLGAAAGEVSAVLGSAVGSLTNSVGMAAMTGGRTGVSMNFGAGEINFGSGKVDWLFDKGLKMNLGEFGMDLLRALPVLEDYQKFVEVRLNPADGVAGMIGTVGDKTYVPTFDGTGKFGLGYKEVPLDKLSELPDGTHMNLLTGEAVPAEEALSHKGMDINFQSKGEAWTLHLDRRLGYYEVHIDRYAGFGGTWYKPWTWYNVGTGLQHGASSAVWGARDLASQGGIKGVLGKFFEVPAMAFQDSFMAYYEAVPWAF